MDGTRVARQHQPDLQQLDEHTFGSAMLGHIDRTRPRRQRCPRSWNSAHMSRSCSQADLVATGGNGLFYCFAQ